MKDSLSSGAVKKVDKMIQSSAVVTSPPDDASHLLSLFPEEVWRLILAKVGKPSDYFKICGASPAFWEWFSDERVHLLFEPVMKILMEKGALLAYPETVAPAEPDVYYGRETRENWITEFLATLENNPEEIGSSEESDSGKSIEQDQEEMEDKEGGGSGDDYSSVSAESDQSDLDSEEEDDNWEDPFHYLAPLRQVCRSWKAAVDHIIQEPFKVPLDHSPRNKHRSNMCIANFAKVGDFQRFETHFMSTHFTSGANPFPGRAVRALIYDIDDDGLRSHGELEQLCNSSLRLLRDYGRHIYNLTLQMRVCESSEVLKFYLQLKQMLPLLPALKVFLLIAIAPGDLTDAQDTELVTAYSRADTPMLPSNLETLTIHGYKYNFPSRLLKLLLLQASPRLTFLGLPWLHMEDFHIIFDGWQLRLPLTRLRLPFKSQSLPVCWTQVFDTLETLCGETLTELHLRLPTPTNTLEVVPQLKLLKLRKLELHLTGELVPLDFLLGVASTLETLDLFLATPEPKQPEAIVKMEGLQLNSEKLVNSNVWNLFPQLQTLQVNVSSNGRQIFLEKLECTRAEWEASVNQ